MYIYIYTCNVDVHLTDQNTYTEPYGIRWHMIGIPIGHKNSVDLSMHLCIAVRSRSSRAPVDLGGGWRRAAVGQCVFRRSRKFVKLKLDKQGSEDIRRSHDLIRHSVVAREDTWPEVVWFYIYDGQMFWTTWTKYDQMRPKAVCFPHEIVEVKQFRDHLVRRTVPQNGITIWVMTWHVGMML